MSAAESVKEWRSDFTSIIVWQQCGTFLEQKMQLYNVLLSLCLLSCISSAPCKTAWQTFRTSLFLGRQKICNDGNLSSFKQGHRYSRKPPARNVEGHHPLHCAGIVIGDWSIRIKTDTKGWFWCWWLHDCSGPGKSALLVSSTSFVFCFIICLFSAKSDSDLGRFRPRCHRYIINFASICSWQLLNQNLSDTYLGVGKHTELEPPEYVTRHSKVCTL